MERVIRPARAGQALAVGAGIRGSHHGNRRNPGQGAGGLDHQDLPKRLPIIRLRNGKDSGVLRHRMEAVFPADLYLGRNNGHIIHDIGIQGEDAGDDLPKSQFLIHNG